MGAFTISSVFGALVQFYGLLIFAYVIMSWFRPTGTMWEIYHVLGKVCEPYLGLFRRFVPSMGGLDFSPMIALLVLSYGGSMIARLLAGLGV